MVFLAYVVCFWYVCTGPPFLAHLKNLGGGTQFGATFLVYVVAHLDFLVVAHLTGENV